MIYELCCSVYQSLEMHDKNVERNKRLDIKDTTMFHIIEADNLHNAIMSFCEKYDNEIKQLSSRDELYFYQLENGKIIEYDKTEKRNKLKQEQGCTLWCTTLLCVVV